MSLTRVYLGNPTGPFGMQKLPAIPIGSPLGGSGGMSPSMSRGAVPIGLLSGGVATMRKPKTKGTYPISWRLRKPATFWADYDLLSSFFNGVQGGGPYCLIDPSVANYLPANMSTFGAVLGAVPEWVPTVGAIAPGTQAPPTGFLSGVANWTGSANASVLYMGLSNVIDGTILPPVVSGLSHRMSVWAKLVSGSGSLAAAMLYGVAGATPAGTAATGTTTALNTSTWVEVPVGVANSFSWATTADYAMLKLTVSSASSPNILLAGASMTYDTTTNASAPSPWVSGLGVPRVVIPGDAQSPVGRPTMRDFTMTLQES